MSANERVRSPIIALALTLFKTRALALMSGSQSALCAQAKYEKMLFLYIL
jgi:hypothetical protein